MNPTMLEAKPVSFHSKAKGGLGVLILRFEWLEFWSLWQGRRVGSNGRVKNQEEDLKELTVCQTEDTLACGKAGFLRVGTQLTWKMPRRSLLDHKREEILGHSSYQSFFLKSQRKYNFIGGTCHFFLFIFVFRLNF